MRNKVSTFMLAGLLWGVSALAAQTPAPIIGTWKAELRDQDRKDAPREVIVRDDSSASWAKETARWRLKPDSIMIALGGEWVTYRLQVNKDKMTLSGGDLAKPITLTRVGAATPRPDGVAVPPDPDKPS